MEAGLLHGRDILVHLLLDFDHGNGVLVHLQQRVGSGDDDRRARRAGQEGN